MRTRDPQVKAFVDKQLAECQCIEDLDERAKIVTVEKAGTEAGLNARQRRRAQEILLAHYMKAIGRA